MLLSWHKKAQAIIILFNIKFRAFMWVLGVLVMNSSKYYVIKTDLFWKSKNPRDYLSMHHKMLIITHMRTNTQTNTHKHTHTHTHPHTLFLSHPATVLHPPRLSVAVRATTTLHTFYEYTALKINISIWEINNNK